MCSSRELTRDTADMVLFFPYSSDIFTNYTRLLGIDARDRALRSCVTIQTNCL